MSTKPVLSEILESSDVRKRFIAATETRHRVQASLMMETISMLYNAVESHRHLSRVINRYVIETETSLTTAMSTLFTSIGFMMRADIYQQSFYLLSILNRVYSQNVDYLVTGLSAQLQDCDSLAAEAHVTIIIAQSTVISATERDRLQLLHDRLVYLQKRLIVFHSMLDNAALSSPHQWHYFPDRLLIDDCNRVFQNVNESLKYQIGWLDDFIPTATYVVSRVDAIVFSNMTSLRTDMSSLSKCLTSYKEELAHLRDRLHSMSTNFDAEFAYEPPVAMLSKFGSGGEWLEKIANGYISDDYSKKQLAEKFASDSESEVTTPVSRLYNDIEMSLFSKVTSRIDEQEENMASFYSDLLKGVTSLQRYMFVNDTSLEQFMRRLSIWRMPTANFQNSLVSLSVPLL